MQERVGAKASTLARLRAAGFPVPDGFVVTTNEDVGAPLVEGLRSLEARIGTGARLAVRSSGRAEDSAAASFAGQYETVLGVSGADELSRAIARCFASFSNERARAYQQGIGAIDTGGAVLVQQLVTADAAGVAFTIDPLSGARDRVLIDAGAGLGDAVVGGRVTPDGFVVLKATGEIVERRVAGRPGMSDEAVRANATMARKVVDQHAGPVDIEWAWRNGQPHLLQARPVTATAASWTPDLNTRIDPRFPLYSNGNVSEILPGCVTPFTYSMFSRGVERAFRSVIESLGSMPDVGPDPDRRRVLLPSRVAPDVSYFMTAADNSPGATRDTVYEELIGPPDERHPAWSRTDLLPWRLWRAARIIGRYLALQRRLPADIVACRALFGDLRARFDSPDLSEWPSEDLAAWIEMNDASLEPAIVHIRASQCANASFAALRALTRASLGDHTGALASSLVTGLGSVGKTNPAFRMYEIAREIAADAPLRQLFQDEMDDERLFASLNPADDGPRGRLHAYVGGFIERFGHRGFREAELRCPVWRERPATVLAHIQQYLEPAAAAPDVIATRQESVSREAREHARAQLPFLKRGWFDTLLTSARSHIAAREEMKDLLLRFHDLTRRVVAEAKRRLGGVLEEEDDIYFLLNHEVATALSGTLQRAAIASLVRKRRREFDRCVAVDRPEDSGWHRPLDPQIRRDHAPRGR